MSETEKPRAKSDMKCPLWRKPMKQVCHTCEWWTHIRGKHPQGEEILDQWGCAMVWLPVLMIENSQMQRQTAASIDKVATVINATGEEATALRAEIVGRVIRTAINDAGHHMRISDATDYRGSR
jgi:ATP phosphoribosyltransferase regulatory subunit HisZ